MSLVTIRQGASTASALVETSSGLLVFDKTLFAHSPKAVNERSRWRSNTQEADAPDLLCLLRPCRERPRIVAAAPPRSVMN